jgi:trimeric autotransporter adhesin
MRPYIFIPGLLFALLFSTFFSVSFSQTITTIAGGIGDDTTAIIYGRTFRPSDFAKGVGGDVVFADFLTTNSSRYFRKLDPVTGIITSIPAPFGTSLIKVGSDWYYIYNGIVYKQSSPGVVTQVAGSGTSSYSGDGGLATSAGVSPKGIAFDNSGNLYIADGYNRRVRKVNTLGIISTVAGNGSSGFSGDGGNALLASLKNDGGIALDAIGNLYIMDDGNNRIRKVDPSGIITTFAGGGTQTGNGVPATMAKLVSIKSIAEDGLGNLYVATRYAVKKIDGSGTINTVAGTDTAGYSGDGGPATSARLNEVANVAFDGAGNFYIADQNNSRIRKVNSAGVITTVVGNNLPFSGFGGDGGSPLLAVFANINSLAADRFGNIFIADGLNNRVRKLNASGSINTVAGNGFSGFVGDGVPATDAAIDYPTNIAVDKFGNLFITSYNNHHIRKVNSAGTVSIYAGGGADPGDGIPATAALIAANGLTVDTAGNVYFSELETQRVRKIDVVTGLVTTIAGGGVFRRWAYRPRLQV